MFDLQSYQLEELKVYSLINRSSGEYVRIVPEAGALVLQLALAKNNRIYTLLNAYSSSQQIKDQVGYRGSKLSPFPNRLDKGKFEFEGQLYQLPLNFPTEANSIHGFVNTKPFQVCDQIIDDSRVSITVEYEYQGSLPGFPFKFLLRTVYSLSENGFRCDTILKNLDNRTIPYGDGWHPYFQLENQEIDNAILKLPPSYEFETENMIPNASKSLETKFSNSHIIGTQKFDTGYELLSKKERAETQISFPSIDVNLSVWQINYPFLQVYTPPDRSSIAIEPMTCATNAFNNKMGLIKLLPGEQFMGSYGVCIF